MSTPTQPRPKSPASAASKSPRDKLIAAGRELFFAHGFSRVSTDMLARRARTSKAALYRYFENASEILVEVMTNESKRFEAGVPLRCDTRREFDRAILDYGTRLLRFLNDPEVIRFSQLIHEEARAHPDVAATFYNAAYGATHKNLTEMIRHGVDSGYLDLRISPAEAAEQLVGMWESLRWTRALMGLNRRPYTSPESWSRSCIETLFGPAGSESGPRSKR